MGWALSTVSRLTGPDWRATESGNISEGEAFVDLDDNRVTILFPRTITEAVEAASVDHGTVFTFDGSPNPAATIES